MESQVSPKNIQERAEVLNNPVEPVVPEVKETPIVTPEVKIEPKTEVKVEPKTETKVESKTESKQPNDPIELRKWATKASQENATLRDEMKALKAAIEKLSKKPIDYKELAKNPEAIQKQIEQERAEAIAEMQETLQNKTQEAIKNETMVERMRREQDKENYPEWKRVFPLIQNLAANTDGRINFNQAPAIVLDSLYELALQLAPNQVAEAAKVPVKEETKVVGKTPEEISALEAAAEKRGYEKAQAALRAEQAGSGIGSTGRGGKRSSTSSKEALQNMPLADLKKMISQE